MRFILFYDMQDLDFNAITTDQIESGLFTQKQLEASVLRLDQIHPVISGNKWFKLQYYIRDAIEKGISNIITFGGAYSNHIIATAAACRKYRLQCTGIIRGEEPSRPSPTLNEARGLGMKLIFISREDYALKKLPPSSLPNDYYLINEGGYGAPGAKGASSIVDYFDAKTYSHICCAVGTGTMMAGLINATSPAQIVTGISVMKNNLEMEASVQSLLIDKEKPFRLIHDYHFGGYAKHTAVLTEFMNRFYAQTRTPSDFVYTAKLFYGITDLAGKDHFLPGSRLMIIHSGGLQGNASLSKGTLIF
jgi:1-aminocyclopropane-1-carboxylate deaminase